MSNCCAGFAASTDRVTSCPTSGTSGKPVEIQTVKALLTSDALQRVNTSSHRFCPEPTCEVVYFDERDHMYLKADVRVPVWQKEPFGDRIVCYCFGVSRASGPAARFSDLAGAVRAPIDSLAREFHRRRITVVSTLEPIALSGVDLEVIFQICLNLYLNARDAMASKGGGKLEVTLRRCDGFAEIAVQDSGTGVPEAFRSRMFLPLQTTKGERGTGLGLSVARTQIRSMGGDIVFETKQGIGSTFRVRLPLEKSSPLRYAGLPATPAIRADACIVN
jgi:hypothetical protein